MHVEGESERSYVVKEVAFHHWDTDKLHRMGLIRHQRVRYGLTQPDQVRVIASAPLSVRVTASAWGSLPPPPPLPAAARCPLLTVP